MTSPTDVSVTVAELRDRAAIVAPFGHLSGEGRWNAAESMRRAADSIETKDRELSRIKEAIRIKGGNEHSPTWDAYEVACRAIDKHRARALAAEARLAEVEAEARKVIEPFAKVIITLSGHVGGLERNHLEAARSFLNAQEKA